jgi:hypothetical protein
LEWSAKDEELSQLSEKDLQSRFDAEFEAWEKTGAIPSLFNDTTYVDALDTDRIAAIEMDKALATMNRLFHSLEKNLSELDPLQEGIGHLTELQADGEQLDRDFFKMGPFTHDDIATMDLWELEESHFVDHEAYPSIAANLRFDGLGITEMLYKIEKSRLDDKIKAALRPLYTYKGTHKEVHAKRILMPFVTEEQQWQPEPEKYSTIKQLFEKVQTLKMDPIKKAEILAYSHWADTPKGDALRPVLERAIANHNIDPVAARLQEIDTKKQDILGIKGLGNEFPFEVEGPNKRLYSSPVYDAANPPIPRIEDPSVTYTSENDDSFAVGLIRVAQQTGISVDDLRRFRTKNLVFHRVVNQTRKGKIQSLYALCVAGNENGLLGIGEGKAFEPEDALLKARLAALRNVAPIIRYEKRTIYGELDAKVGGCTVKLMSRPPGKFIRSLHYLVFTVSNIHPLHRFWSSHSSASL